MRAAVLGSPIAHSLSPRLHRAAYAALGLSDWTYDAVLVDSGSLPGFLDGLGADWAGLSLTMPLKQEVLPLLTSVSPLVTVTGAANTVLLRDGERLGHNTDVYGVLTALREAGITSVSRGAILGAGATAASVLVALHELGAHHVRVLARSAARAALLQPVADAVGVELRFGTLDPLEIEDGWPELVVNTTPAGALDWFVGESSPGGTVPALMDVAYASGPTPLAAVYAAAGGVVVSGLQMLLHQAAMQVELMTGLPAPLEAMRAGLQV